GARRRTASSPASMSTPASRYVSGFTRGGLAVGHGGHAAGRPPIRLEERELRGLLRLDADAIVAREARVTEARGIGTRRLQHPIEREIPAGIGAEVTPDLLDLMGGADQLLARGRIDIVVARPVDRRGRRADVLLA